MRPTYRGKVSIAILVALAFCATIFADVLIFTAFIFFLFLVLTGALWTAITKGTPRRFFACTKTLMKEGEQYSLDGSTYPGEEIEKTFFFTKKARGETLLSSKIEYLRLSPNKIGENASATRVQARFKTPYSGEYHATELDVEITDPLGLFQGKCSIPFSINFIVYPKLLDIALTTMKILGKGGIGEFPINAPGIGTEPYDMRFYQSGDDVRQINWKATARIGELVVTEHSREIGASYYIVLEALASDYFDRDRLASTFLQMANSLTLLSARFGVVVHDGDHITALKKLDQSSDALEFALNAALDFADLKSKKLQSKLAVLPSHIMKTNRDALSLKGLTLLSQLEEMARSQMRKSVKEDPFKTLVELVDENSDEPPAVFYVSSLFDSLEPVVEAGSQINRIYGSDFIVLNPVSPWVVASSEEQGAALYERFSKNLEILRKARIKYQVGEPGRIVEELLSG